MDRRRRASDPPMSGWLGLVRIILNASGPVGLLAVGLTAFLAYSVWQRLDTIEDNQRLILEAMHQANVSMAAFVAESNEGNRQRSDLMAAQVRLLRQLCINAAERDAQAQACQ